MKSISIVLASYNGQKYIDEQIKSIIDSEDYGTLVECIILSDDGSSDKTIETAKKYEEVRVVKNKNKKGVTRNFMNGLKDATTKYVMFCDQDDLWLPDKIKTAYDEIKKLESIHGENVPLLNFCDLKITDDKLSVIHNSFMSYHNIKVDERITYPKLVLNNIAPGCVCIINRKMVECMISSESYIESWIMHDWWMMLIASSLGGISFSNRSLMLYRQHGSNVVGYKEKKSINKFIFLKKTLDDYSESLTERIKQYKAFEDYLRRFHGSEGFIGNIDKNIRFVLANECSTKRKICSLVNFIRHRFRNNPVG